MKLINVTVSKPVSRLCEIKFSAILIQICWLFSVCIENANLLWSDGKNSWKLQQKWDPNQGKFSKQQQFLQICHCKMEPSVTNFWSKMYTQLHIWSRESAEDLKDPRWYPAGIWKTDTFHYNCWAEQKSPKNYPISYLDYFVAN